MILTDREIRISLETGAISIVPSPALDAYSSTSLDLTLADTLSEFRPTDVGLEVVVDPAKKGYRFSAAVDRLADTRKIPDDGYVLPPGRLVLGWTIETVGLYSQARIAGRVEGKSSLARLGLAVHITAPTIHAGFKGQIQLEIINHGHVPIRLRTGMKICQLIFESTLGVPETGYRGQFSGQQATS